MEKIILGLSLFLLLIQNGFAGEKEDIQYANQQKNHQALYQLILCQNQTNYHQKNANINVCLKAIHYIKQGKDLGFVSSQRKKYLATAYLKAGVLYHVSEKDYIKAYEFYMKAAKLGDKYAQNNLDILCKQHPWVCK